MLKVNLPRAFTVFQSRYDGYCFYQYLDASFSNGQKVLVKVHVRALHHLPLLRSALNATPYFTVAADDVRLTNISVDDDCIVIHYALEHSLNKGVTDNV